MMAGDTMTTTKAARKPRRPKGQDAILVDRPSAPAFADPVVPDPDAIPPENLERGGWPAPELHTAGAADKGG